MEFAHLNDAARSPRPRQKAERDNKHKGKMNLCGMNRPTVIPEEPGKPEEWIRPRLL